MTTLILDREPAACKITIRSEKLIVDLADGQTLVVPLEWYSRLAYAAPRERQNWILLGKGYAIEWPDLDEHIGVASLLAGHRSGDSMTAGISPVPGDPALIERRYRWPVIKWAGV